MENKMLNDILDSIIKNASPSDIEMIREKLNQYFINTIYDEDIRTELENTVAQEVCPVCGSHKRIKYGKDKKHHQRYQCSDCGKTYSTVTGTLLAYTKKEPYQWYIYIESLLNCDTIVVAADKAGICEQTSLVWRHKILSVLKTLTDNDPELKDTVYLDETLRDTTHPGITANEPVKVKRGISDQKRNIVCAVDIHNNKVIQVSERGRIHSDPLISIYEKKISSKCTVVSDSLRSYHKLMKTLGVNWIKIDSGKKEKDGYTLEKINHLHSSIQGFLDSFKGISDKYLIHYVALYKYKDQNKKYYNKNILIQIFATVVNRSCAIRFKHFEKLNHEFDWLYGLN